MEVNLSWEQQIGRMVTHIKKGEINPVIQNIERIARERGGYDENATYIDEKQKYSIIILNQSIF